MTTKVEQDQIASDESAGLLRSEIGRRSMLRNMFLGLGAASLPAWVLKGAVARAAELGGLQLDIPLGPLGAQDFGPLVKQVVADDLTNVDHSLYAPAGFSVRVVARAGVNPVSLLPVGTLGHVNPDGGASYPAPDGGWVYVSNSETTPGGVGALRFDANGKVVDYYRIAANTRNNCAGGSTPWGTWITCEEVTGGYAYECDPFGTPATQRRLDALGARNGREAVAIDSIHHVCYQTLDSGSGKFVRFVSDASDLEALPSGVTRMRMENGVSERLFIPAYGELPAFDNVTVPNNATGSAQLRLARPIQWVADTGSNGTNFNGGEGIWYYEVPEALATIPSAGTVPTRGVIFFASKGDNRIWAIDIENSLIELIYDTHNSQAFANLRNADGSVGNFSQVDNVYVSPHGDVLVAEDGTAMRLAIMFNDKPAKLLMQITRGGSEITGPTFSPDGTRLYFSSQRGPSGPTGTGSSGTIYEMTIPPRFRAIQRAEPFSFVLRFGVARNTVVTSDRVTLDGFEGPLQLSISQNDSAQLQIDEGAWVQGPVTVYAGDSVRVRHLSGAEIYDNVVTLVTVGLPNGISQTTAEFRSATMEEDAQPDWFTFSHVEDVPAATWIESSTIRITGFNVPVAVQAGPDLEYRIDGGAWTTADGMYGPEQTLQVRIVSGAEPQELIERFIVVGGVEGWFVTRTGG